MKEPDDFDALLDQVLASYAEPAAGLEDRVLRRAKSAARIRILCWSAAPLAAALVIAAFVLFPFVPADKSDHSGVSAPAPSRAQNQPIVADSRTAGGHPMGTLHHRVRRVAARFRADPGNRVPYPLVVRPNAQERALRIALEQPGFLAALDAAEAPLKDWDTDQNPDASENETTTPEPRP
jgi:hypothetical protein